ncbi:MAG: hypothetical protein ABIL77_04430, partial [candidate division WOR-3 bacterium]
MDVTRVARVLRLINKGFGKVVNDVYLTGDGVYFDAGYVLGYFVDVIGLERLGDKVVKVPLKDLELLFRGELDLRLEGDVVVFDKGSYEVQVGVVESFVKDEVVRRMGVGDGGGFELELDELVFSGFDTEELLSENVVSAVEECYVMGGRVIVVDPVWLLVGEVSYRGEGFTVSRGLLTVANDLRGGGIRFRVYDDRVVLRFGELGLVALSKRISMGRDFIERVLLMIEDFSRKAVYAGISGLDWVEDF